MIMATLSSHGVLICADVCYAHVITVCLSLDSHLLGSFHFQIPSITT